MSTEPDRSATGSGTARCGHFVGNPAVNIERREDGTIYLRPKTRLGDYPVRITDRLRHWANAEPHRVFMAERNAARGWRQITYAELLSIIAALSPPRCWRAAFRRSGQS